MSHKGHCPATELCSAEAPGQRIEHTYQRPGVVIMSSHDQTVLIGTAVAEGGMMGPAAV